MSTQNLRTVEQNIFVSTHMPALSMKVDNVFTYAGSLQFVLSQTVQVEQFLFVDASEGKVKRLFEVQIEGHLPGNDLKYEYPIADVTALGSHEYACDAAFQDLRSMIEASPDSDFARADGFLVDEGYSMADYVIRVRLVRVIGETRRNEILFLYFEDASYSGMNPVDFSYVTQPLENESSAVQQLLARALASFTILEG